MTVYGDSANYIGVLTTAITTSAGVSSPSGSAADTIFFKCKTYLPKRDFRIRTTLTLDGGTYTPVKGKKGRSCRLSEIQIIDDDGEATDNTESLNNKVNVMDAWQDLDGSPVFLILYSNIDGKNISLSRNKTEGNLDYMKGYIDKIDTIPKGGEYYLNITFKESTLL